MVGDSVAVASRREHTHCVEVLLVVIAIVVVVGTISNWATLINARKLLPKIKLGPFVSSRMRTLWIGVGVLVGLAFLVFVVGFVSLLNAPSGQVHHWTYVTIIVGLAATLVLIVVWSLISYRALDSDVPRYSIRGRKIQRKHRPS